MAEDQKTVQQKVQESRVAQDLVEAREENARLAAELAKAKGSAEEIEEPRVFRDPFDAQNPLTFKKHPQGFVLGWINPVYRESHRGWRGWQPVTYDSAIGKRLHEYLTDPPRKLATATDNIVRRGDCVLGALPEEIWLARQQKRNLKAAHQRAEHAAESKDEAPTQRMLKRKEIVDDNTVPGRTMTS